MKTTKHWKDIFSTIISDADVILEVLDARNPIGTRNLGFEKFVEKNAPEKSIYLILNKIDLIPKDVLHKWYDYFQKTTDKRVFSISARYNRGMTYFKSNLRRILANGTYKAIIVGYPNTGKSSLINALSKNRNPVGTSSKAGYTRGVMEIKIGEQITLIDTPGVIPTSEDDEIDQALKAVINPEKITDKETVVYKIIDLFISVEKIMEHFKIDKQFLSKNLDEKENASFIKNYFEKMDFQEHSKGKIAINSTIDSHNEISSSLSYSDFMTLIRMIAIKLNMLRKAGEIDENRVYTKIIHAWQKNRIKYYVNPPEIENSNETNEKEEND